MTKIVSNTIRMLATAGGLAAIALVAAPPVLADRHVETGADTGHTEGEARLAELLKGRVAGAPQNCIRSRLNDRLTVIDETAYVYGRGQTIYVQRTMHPEDIDRDDALVSSRFGGSQLCRQDVMSTIDPFNGFFTGAVFFDEFIPYTRVEQGDG